MEGVNRSGDIPEYIMTLQYLIARPFQLHLLPFVRRFQAATKQIPTQLSTMSAASYVKRNNTCKYSSLFPTPLGLGVCNLASNNTYSLNRVLREHHPVQGTRLSTPPAPTHLTRGPVKIKGEGETDFEKTIRAMRNYTGSLSASSAIQTTKDSGCGSFTGLEDS